MGTLRRQLTARPWLALAIVLAALAARLVSPAGFMPAKIGNRIVITLCSGHGPEQLVQDFSTHPVKKAPATNTDQPCGFSALGLAMHGGADPLLLAIALVFAMALALAPRTPPPAETTRRLRPPLRAPPAR